MRKSVLAAGALVFFLGLALRWSWSTRLSPARQHFDRGMELSQQEQWNPSMAAEYERALFFDPRLVLAHDVLAQFYLESDDPLEALRPLGVLQSLAPETSHLRCRLAQVWWMLGDEPTAYQFAQEEIAQDAECPTAHGLIQRQSESKETSRMAQESQQTALRQRQIELLRRLPQERYNADLLLQLARVNLDQGQRRLALIFLDDALKLHANHPQARQLVAQLRTPSASTQTDEAAP